VYEVIVKGLEFVGVDAAFGAGENTASLLALKHPGKIKLVAIAGAIAMYSASTGQSLCSSDSVRYASMTTVLLRHFPELIVIAQRSSNAFTCW
jgi:hypothetical protein